MRYRQSLAALLVILAAGATAGAVEETGAFRSPAAIAARQTYERKAEAIEREYRQKTAAAQAEYATALEQAKLAMTKEGNLDEAIRIRDAIAHAKTAAAAQAKPVVPDRSTNTKLATALARTTWAAPAFSFVVGPDGRFSTGGENGSGRWLALDERRAILLFDNGWINILTFDEGLTGCKADEARPTPGWTGKRVMGE